MDQRRWRLQWGDFWSWCDEPSTQVLHWTAMCSLLSFILSSVAETITEESIGSCAAQMMEEWGEDSMMAKWDDDGENGDWVWWSGARMLTSLRRSTRWWSWAWRWPATSASRRSSTGGTRLPPYSRPPITINKLIPIFCCWRSCKGFVSAHIQGYFEVKDKKKNLGLPRQACSSHHHIVIWICFWFDKLNQSTNTETAMLWQQCCLGPPTISKEWQGLMFSFYRSSLPVVARWRKIIDWWQQKICFKTRSK